MNATWPERLQVGKVGLPLGVDKLSPKNRFHLVPCKDGSLFARKTDVLNLLAIERPHMVCLQECQSRLGAGAAFACLACGIGYAFVPHKSLDLGAFASRGLSLPD